MPIEAWLQRIGLCQAPVLTTAHKVIGAAAVTGILFTVAHLATVIVTCATNGFDWGVNAWIFDMMGWLAGFCFALVCWKSSNKATAVNKKDNFWIIVWSGITLGVRVLDVMMLFGIVQISAIYHTPTGAVLYANIVSEIVIAIPYNLLAFVGSLHLLCRPQDAGAEGQGAQQLVANDRTENV